tara:strand:+ start:93 stop:539 length:447 start_codon:yes stop_codon:yes gene_type:complete
MRKKVFILADKSLFDFDSSSFLNGKYSFFFYKKNTKNIYKISESLKIKDYLILVFENKKNISLEKKILFLSSFLEIANNSKIKNKIFICNVVKSKNLNNFNKLEKNIFIEIINSFNNMFSLNLIFSNYVNKEKTISFIKILKEFKIYN